MFENYCKDEFWSNNTWGNDFPEVSQCFQETCLTFCWFLFIWTIAPCYYYSKRNRYRKLCRKFSEEGGSTRKQKLSFLAGVKIFVVISIILVITLEMALSYLVYDEEVSISAIVSYAMKLSVFLVNIYQNVLDIKYAVVGSAVQFWFWLITAILSLAKIQTIVLSSNDCYKILSTAYCTLVVFEFLLQNIAESFSDFQFSSEERSSLIAKITFHWFNEVIYKGFKNKLTLSSLPEIKNDFNVEDTVNEFRKVKSKHKSSLIVLLFISNFGVLATAGIFKFLNDVIIMVNPQIQKLLIKHVLSTEEASWKGYLFAFMMLIFSNLQTICINQFFFNGHTAAIRMRTAVVSEIFRKTLRLSNSARQTHTTGEITNLMAIDSQRFLEVIPFVHFLWSSPFQIGLNLYFMNREMGLSSFAGVGVLALILPVNFICSKISKTLQVKQLSLKDKRIKLMNEILSGIKVLKLYGWEIPFMSRVLDARSEEIAITRRQGYLIGVMDLVFSVIAFLMTFATIGTFLLLNPGTDLKPEKLFVCISLINNIRIPLLLFPMYFTKTVLLFVSLKRITSFLGAEELEDVSDVKAEENLNDGEVTIKDCDFSWNGNDLNLQKVSLEFKRKSLTMIIGKVGSGKSTLLNSIFGETKRTRGRLSVSGRISYVSQQPWIQNMTLRNNILFGSKFNSVKYNHVLDVCALKDDLEVLPDGDQTEIGENGINLSGGQKQRISIARSLYKDADVYIFDDPLSAVDAHVGEHIFNKVIGPNGHLKNKTRIVATNSIHFLHLSDDVVWLKNGEVYVAMPYEELSENEIINEITSLKPTSIKDKSSFESNEESKTAILATDVADININEEKVDTGARTLTAFNEFIRSVGKMSSFLIVLSFATGHLIFTFSNIMLAQWTDSINGTNSNQKYFIIFSALGFGGILHDMVRLVMFWYSCAKAAKIVHNKLLQRVMHCPMSFFDVNPTGRILNRFSSDIAVVDSNIPTQLADFLYCFFQTVFIMAVISYSNTIFLSVFVPLLIIYLTIQRFFITTSRQLKRLESVARSPIFTHFNEAVNGTAVIRAFAQQDRFTDESLAKVYNHLKIYFLGQVANRWLSFRIEVIGSLVIFFSAIFSVINRGVIGAGFVGLLISYSLSITDTLAWVVRMMCELETNAISLERINEYIDETQEDEWVKAASVNQGHTWPSVGRIEFRDFSTRYRENLPLTLKNISLEIRGGEKIGVCGRTGAGKSSLSLSLFRLIEAADGEIVVDDTDIASLGLHDLRQNLTIIPQDPVLFMGSVRFNLDPNECYDDEEIWRALENVHLKSVVEGWNDELGHFVEENGTNLSVGQRQLICLARAILRKTKVLILDEATAAIDFETDRLIQTTIRDEFQDCTVITIAHRLHTIINSNRILVLEYGKIAEYGEPGELLQNENSLFYGLSKAAGINC